MSVVSALVTLGLGALVALVVALGSLLVPLRPLVVALSLLVGKTPADEKPRGITINE